MSVPRATEAALFLRFLEDLQTLSLCSEGFFFCCCCCSCEPQVQLCLSSRRRRATCENERNQWESRATQVQSRPAQIYRQECAVWNGSFCLVRDSNLAPLPPPPCTSPPSRWTAQRQTQKLLFLQVSSVFLQNSTSEEACPGTFGMFLQKQPDKRGQTIDLIKALFVLQRFK